MAGQAKSFRKPCRKFQLSEKLILTLCLHYITRPSYITDF